MGASNCTADPGNISERDKPETEANSHTIFQTDSVLPEFQMNTEVACQNQHKELQKVITEQFSFLSKTLKLSKQNTFEIGPERYSHLPFQRVPINLESEAHQNMEFEPKMNVKFARKPTIKRTTTRSDNALSARVKETAESSVNRNIVNTSVNGLKRIAFNKAKLSNKLKRSHTRKISDLLNEANEFL